LIGSQPGWTEVQGNDEERQNQGYFEGRAYCIVNPIRKYMGRYISKYSSNLNNGPNLGESLK
jgi:hypothetical protein